MAAYILKAARDPNINAIVFRINSPGGLSLRKLTDVR